MPLVAGAVADWSGVVSIELPQWLLAAAYVLIGWRIGLGFTGELLRYASRALPKILLSIAVLIVFCGGLAFLLTRVVGVDPLTAYLATSPGGIDSIAIIAASSQVDLPFVMALQTVRLLVVILIGPMFAGIVARRMTIAKPSLADEGSQTSLILEDCLPPRDRSATAFLYFNMPPASFSRRMRVTDQEPSRQIIKGGKIQSHGFRNERDHAVGHRIDHFCARENAGEYTGGKDHRDRGEDIAGVDVNALALFLGEG